MITLILSGGHDRGEQNMLSELETGAGLDFVLRLQAGSSDFLDILATLLHQAGGDIFFLVILSLVYWCLNRQLGLRLLYALILAVTINVALKLLIQAPRPFMVSDAVRLVIEDEGLGFPSAHVMIAVVMWGYLAYYLRRTWLAVGVALYVLLMAWSRMYLGVHYPQDVIGGLVFGLLLLALFIWLVEHFAPAWSRLSLTTQAAVVTLAGIVMFVFLSGYDSARAVTGILIGTTIGITLEQRDVRFSVRGSVAQRALRFAAGMLLVMVVFFGLRVLFGALADEGTLFYDALRVIRYALVTVAAVYVWPLLALRLGLVSAGDDESLSTIPVPV